MWEARSRLNHANNIIMARGKKYKEALSKISEKDSYSVSEAVKLLKETSVVKFDATAEVHLKLGIDPKKAEQAIRGTTPLPHGTGKTLKIAAVVSDDKIKDALAAGATSAGLEDLIAEFSSGKFNYDVVIASPDVMRNLGKVAKTLGQKGLMPNPKSGTVTVDPIATIKEIQAGRVEYRNDKEGNIHAIFGKVSFKAEQLEENLRVILNVLRDAKPSTIKGTFIKSLSVNATMAPSIKIGVNEMLKELSN